MGMKQIYLEVTFRHGRALAAYLYLPRRSREKSYRTTKTHGGLLVDFSRSGRPIGIEITAPSKLTVGTLNRVLRELGQPTVKRADLGPLRAA